ncbi:zinc-binding alcohol dehydrogenase family protein [Lederbergia citrea]|uniref:Zinc-binding alcohol dehydrogenase family protein n=1 Tax=Lederbergia citrea TaxID=2833581 RepID=A0A942USL8_9BACI|nr:zinc-binding alcohol dehydrogenase family protein [Lederbergia citrea]MBS4178223.1 zinc-binding alcohol dehydrogenase family protein [Lederbergia citrea]MBS4223249.1 zinc-binding alcohol dehydrogenase family protein [Lederbergia citrea]
MKTIVCQEPYKWALIESEKPTCQQGEALVRVQRIGICGTDLHAFCGNQPYFTYPRVLGHELSGTVEEIRSEDTTIKVGDQVSIIPYLECGHCPACRSGKTNCCSSLKVLGVHQDGGMTEFISVPADHLIEANDLTLDQAAIIEPLSIGAHAVRRAKLQKGEKVLVIGAGPIGLGVMAFAKLQGATVAAMDMNKERLHYSKNEIGIDHTVHAGENTINELRELFNGELPETVFDATGNVHSMNASFAYPEQGGKLIFVGLVKDNVIFSDPEFHRKELTLMSSRNSTKEDFLHVKQALESSKVHIDGFLTHHCHFQEMPIVFEDWLTPESNVIKAIVEISN